MALSSRRNASLPSHFELLASTYPDAIGKRALFRIAGDVLVAALAAASGLALDSAFDTNVATTLSDVLVLAVMKYLDGFQGDALSIRSVWPGGFKVLVDA